MQYSDYLTQLTQHYTGPFTKEIRLTPQIFLLLNDLTINPEIPTLFHADLYAAMGYFVAPYDIYPEETFGPIGFIDDILFALEVLTKISLAIGREPVYDTWPYSIETIDKLLDDSIIQIKSKHPSFHRKIKEILNR